MNDRTHIDPAELARLTTANGSSNGQNPLKASEATEPGRFDRFATLIAGTVARAWFFAACVAVVVLWAPSYFVFGNPDTWQLVINTLTTIITFLLVALLQNTQSRDTKSMQRKLNAMLGAMVDLLEVHEQAEAVTRDDLNELRAAVGLEHREGS